MGALFVVIPIIILALICVLVFIIYTMDD